MTNEEKYQQIRREAKWTGIALFLLILFWLAAGFGAAQFQVKVFHLPLWAVTSSIGVWLMAILLVRFLVKYVFRDMDLQDEEGE
ncbi:MAG: YhdT family protein [Selenomonadaceae bacterium]|nr:YhdT family protein [Selenomonadaceae bacterium]